MRWLNVLWHAAVGRTLGGWKRRSLRIEHWLQVVMPNTEAEAVSTACAQSGVCIGAFYRWYWDKARVARLLNRVGSDEVLRQLGKVDATDYSGLDALIGQEQPLIVAMPHHGHYILSILGLVGRLRRQRGVMVFYARPSARPGNAMFDAGFQASSWSGPDSGVQVLHDDRSGLSNALRGLRQGKSLIIMPDVANSAEHTYLVPFAGYAFNAMLGTAALARKTNARIVAAVSRVTGRGLGFRTCFAPVPDGGVVSADAHAIELADYAMTCRLFNVLERMMPDLYRWQFVREHYISRLQLPRLVPDQLAELAAAFLDSSRARLHAARAIPLT